jgi:DinB family protein
MIPTANEISIVLDQLSRGPALVRQVIYEVQSERRKRRPAPGVWSAHEHAVHLPAIYPLVVRRLEQMLSEPAAHIKSYEPSRDDPDDALLTLDLDTEMDRFDRERAALIERLQMLSPAQWAITATHDEYSHYGVFIMFRHLALHDLHHAYRIEDRLLRKEWA